MILDMESVSLVALVYFGRELTQVISSLEESTQPDGTRKTYESSVSGAMDFEEGSSIASLKS